MTRLLLPLLLLVALRPVPARAHGGEDHGEPAPAAPPGAAAGGQRTAYGQTSVFELTLTWTVPSAGAETSLLAYVADYATNAPVEGARIEFEFTGSPAVKVTAEPTGQSGQYHVLAQVPAGHSTVIATIQAGERFDLVEVKGVDLSPLASPLEARSDGRSRFEYALGAALLLSLLGGAALWRHRRRARAAAQAAAGVLIVLISPMLARGHGGEDHGEPVAAVTPAAGSGGVFLSKPSQFLLGIRTLLVGEGKLQARVETVGWVVPRVDGHAHIYPPQSGRVAPVGARLPFLGDQVRAGQPLVRIEQVLGAAESGQVQAESARARAGISEARARIAQGRRDVERMKSMPGLVAEKDLQQAQLDLALALEDLQRARAESEVFGGGLQRLTVTAPIAGVIAEAAATAGEFVAPDRKLFTIVDPRTLWVEAEVFASDVSRLVPGGSALVRVEGEPRAFTGIVFRIGLVAAPSTRTIKTIIAVDNPDGKLRPGQFAETAIDAGPPRLGLSIPDGAVIEEGGRRFVFVHTGPETFARREVVLGIGDGESWLVEKGVKKGERVVVQGTYPLRTAR